jgi:hypothetical protein
MAQAQITNMKKKLSKDASTDTNEVKNMLISISNSKSVQVYYSKSFKEFVVSFNLGSKKFVFSRKKWLYFRNFLEQIDEILIKQ